LYNRGYRLMTQPIAQLFTPAGRIAVPLLNRLRADPTRYRRVFLDILGIMLLMTTPAILFAMLLAHPLALLILGPQWVGVAPIFFWLGLGCLALPLYMAVGWLMVTQDQTKRQMHWVVGTSIIAVVAFIVGLPWGAVGVSACSGVQMLLLTTPLACWGATRHSIVSLADLCHGLWALVVAAGATAAALCLYRAHAAPEGFLGLLGAGVVSYAAFLGTLCLTGGAIVRRAWRFSAVLGARA
jgi:PST family polysaccharide transporter